MRRRLTLALVGLLAGALVLAGFGTLVLTRESARNQDIQELQTQAQGIVSLTQNVQARFRCAPATNRRCVQQRNLRSTILQTIRRVVRLDDALVVTVRPSGSIDGSLPTGIQATDLRPPALLAGVPVSGSKSNLVFAAAPIPPPSGAAATEVVVLTRQEGKVGPSLGYFLLIGAGTLLVGAVVAYRLSRRASRPLVAAVRATARIAAGDLDARVPVHRRDYPEIASLSESINAMAAALARSQGLERQFLLSVSHDLRTPLTSIRGYSEAIADGTATDAPGAARVISTEARRLERLVHDLLELAKLNARSFSLHMARTPAAEVVAQTAEGLRPLVAQAGLDLIVDVTPANPLWVRADPDRLAQIVANLVENAFNFARRRIAVSAAADGGSVLVAVEDDGPGIAPDDLHHVFERLYQSGRAPSRHAGSGLGLAIVDELAGAMGASVTVHSPAVSEGGTRMVVKLQQWPSDSLQPPGPPPSAPDPRRRERPPASTGVALGSQDTERSRPFQ